MAKIETPVPASPQPPLALSCGIIMPISALGECSEAHWFEVREIISSAIEAAGFTPTMVSDAEDIGIIQKRIIQNIYSNPIIVCDVSGKNANVMFELGMRLAFDKPTIIIKDDKTTYSFDTAPIEHLEYPRDLRFPKVIEFQERLTEKIQGTHKKATSDKNYTTFLKHFGTFSVPTLETKEISKEDFILEEIKNLKLLVTSQVRPPPPAVIHAQRNTPGMKSLCLRDCEEGTKDTILAALQEQGLLTNGTSAFKGPKHFHISISHVPAELKSNILSAAKKILPSARLLPNP